MSTPSQLKIRWKLPEQKSRSDAILRLFAEADQATIYKDAADLGPIDTTLIVKLCELSLGLPFAEEVAPNADLRGFEFVDQIRNIDLSGARLDFCVLNHNVADSVMRDAVFDGVKANQLMQHDFSGASFKSANLRRARFSSSNLSNADFSGANLDLATLEAGNCASAKFVGASMRSCHCARCDFRGTDLSSADLTDATLGGVKFDENTIVRGAVMTDAAISSDFRLFAEGHGAIFGTAEG
jgi:uncharacterized protein YjbI with pentapeptide repeats